MLEWNERKVNDIETNPPDRWEAVYTLNSDSSESRRIYSIVPQHPNPNGDGYTVDDSLPPELYVLFEQLEWTMDGKGWYSGPNMFVRAFRTLDEAKKRAEFQHEAIDRIIEDYFPKENK